MTALYSLTFVNRGGVVVTNADGVTQSEIMAVTLVDQSGTAVSLGGTGASASQVQGAQAVGATFGTNPFVVGVIASASSATLPTNTDGKVGVIAGTIKGRALIAGVQSWTPSNGIALASGGGLMLDNTDTAKVLGVLGTLYNGVSIDLMAGNTSGLFVAGAVFWTESSTALGASATISGTLRTNGGTSGSVGTRFNFFAAKAFADQSGTLYVESTTDSGATYQQEGSVAVTANVPAILKIPITAPAYRTRFVNGATAQTVLRLATSYLAA